MKKLMKGRHDMDIQFIFEYVDLVIMGICLCVGFSIKHARLFEKIGNRFIPLIVMTFGCLLNVLVNLDHISLKIVLTGMTSGLCSTGLYELLSKLLYGKKKES